MKTLAIRSRTVVLCAFLFLAIPAMLFAGGSTCALATGLVPDGRVLTLDYLQPSGAVWYSFNSTAGRSYSVEVRDDLDENPNNDLTVTFYSSNCATLMTAISGPPYSSSQYRNTSAIEPKLISGTRVSIPNPAADTIAIKVANSNASMGHYVSVSVSETTIYSPTWVTYGGYTTQFILQNTTSQSINYNLTLTATQGGSQVSACAGSLSGVPNALSTAYLTTASGTCGGGQNSFLSVSANQIGYAIATHDGPPGAVQPYENENNYPSYPASPSVIVIPIGPIRGK